MSRRAWKSINRRRWAAVRRATLDRDGWRCQRCGRPGVLEVHHVRALEDGGAPYDPENLETICKCCHIALHERDPERARRRAWAARAG